MNFLPNNLRFICKRFGVTQEGIALQMKKTQTTIGNWMSGKAEPKIEELLILADYFGFDLTTFVATNVEEGNLITPEIVASFRLKGNLKGNPMGNLLTAQTSKKYDVMHNGSSANEIGDTTNWLLLNEIKRISEKIDRVQVSVDKIGEK